MLTKVIDSFNEMLRPRVLQVEELVREEDGICIAHVSEVHLHQASQPRYQLFLCHRRLVC